MNKIKNITRALYMVELLKLLKRNYSWAEISMELNESPTTLSRYLHGHVIPSDKKMDKLIPVLERIARLDREVYKRIRRDRRSGFIDNLKLIGDVNLLKLVALKYASEFHGRVDLVVSPAADGIPFATLIAEYLGLDLVIVKNRREVGVYNYVEGLHIGEDGDVEILYMPRRLVKKGYRVLIVDDVIRTGGTHRAIVEMIEKVGARVEAILVILVLGDRWESVLPNTPVIGLLRL